jgi:hypothetical protein
MNNSWFPPASKSREVLRCISITAYNSESDGADESGIPTFTQNQSIEGKKSQCDLAAGNDWLKRGKPSIALRILFNSGAPPERCISMNPNTRVIRFHRTGGPEVLQIDEIELPPLKNHEVLLKMDALAISRADILWREGDYVEDPIFPAQIGYDGAGVVDPIGPNTKRSDRGDRVSIFPAASLRCHY